MDSPQDKNNTPDKDAAPTHAAVLYLWDTRTLSMSNTPLPVAKVTAAAHALIVCLEGEFRIKYPDSDQEYVTRSILVSAGYTPNKNYNSTNDSIIVAAVYLNPIGQDYAALSHLMTRVTDGLHVDHRDQDHIISELLKMRNNPPSSAVAYQQLEQLVIPPDLQGKELQKIDPRIITVVGLIKNTVSENVSVGELAEKIHLSSSRLCKLFSNELGIPIRRYRLWRRLFVCTIAVANGKTLLEGGLEAGFSSPAHCSKTYTALVGLSPTAIFNLAKVMKIIVPDSNETINIDHS